MNKINVYTREGCAKCDHVKQVLADVNNVEVNILDTDNSNILAWMIGHDLNVVPVLAIYNDVGEELLVTFGFTKANIANKFKQHTGGELFG
jgi:hypothetical protein